MHACTPRVRSRARLTPGNAPPLPKLGMHCVGVLISPPFRSDVNNLCCPGCPRPAITSCPVSISFGRLAEVGSGNPSAGSSAGASNPSPATPNSWKALAARGATGAAVAEPAAAAASEAAQDAEDPKATQAALCAAVLVDVAAVQVQMVLAQLSKKTRSWFAAGARYGPGGEGELVWVTRAALTPRRQVEQRARIGQMPPNLARVVLDLAIFDRSVGVCGELGVPAQLRKIILKEYRLPAYRYSELKGQFEQALKLFQKTEQDVREGVGGRRQGGAGGDD